MHLKCQALRGKPNEGFGQTNKPQDPDPKVPMNKNEGKIKSLSWSLWDPGIGVPSPVLAIGKPKRKKKD